MTHGNITQTDSNFILSTTEIRQVIDTCKNIQIDLKRERRQGMENALIKLQQTLKEIDTPDPVSTRDVTQFKEEQNEYMKELENIKEPTRLADIRKLRTELVGITSIYRKLDLVTDLPIEKDMLNLKIKEKMLELENLQRLSN